MNKRLTSLLFILASIMLLAGCWDRRELNDIAIVSALGIDKVDDELLVTIQVINPGQVATVKQGGITKAPVRTFQSKARTLSEAMRKVTTFSPRAVYSSHLRMLIIGEDLAKEGMGEIIDYVVRGKEFRTDFYLSIAKNTRAENILKVLSQLETIPAHNLSSSLKLSEKSWGPIETIEINQFVNELVYKGIEPHVIGVEIIGNPEAGEKIENVEKTKADVYLKFGSVAIMRKDKLVDWLTEKESNGLHYALGKVQRAVINVPCKEKKVAIETIRTNSKIQTKVDGHQFKGTIQLHIDGSVAEVQCERMDLEKIETINLLQKKAEEKVKKDILTAIQASQKKYEVDIFGFGEALHRSHPSIWHKVKKDWHSHFKDIPVHVDVDVKLRRIGTINNSPLHEMKP